MEFHGITLTSWEVPWNSMEFGYITKFHGIPWNSMESPNLVEKFHGTPRNYGSSMQRGVTRNSMWISSAPKWTITKFHRIPWNSKGTLVPPNEISLSSMEFHGTLILSFQSIPRYPGLAWDIPWNSMELCSRQIKKITEFHGIPWNKEGAISNDTSIPWNSMEYSMKFHGTLVPPNEI